MPTRPLSHEQRQRQRQPLSRKDADQAYAVQRRARHGPDPRSTARWRRVRALVLAKGPLCADPFHLHGERIVAASEVDHIRSIWEAPEAIFDERNLQPLCHPCHSIKNARERRGLSAVWLICGPPGAGKSTYVRQHMVAGDMVLDFDRMLTALSGRDWLGAREWTTATEHMIRYCWAAYDGVVDLIARRLTQVQQASYGAEPLWQQPPLWVLGTLAERARRRALAERIGARCLVLAVPVDVCLTHIATDPQRQHDVERWRPLIADWWARYEPDAADEEVVIDAPCMP